MGHTSMCQFHTTVFWQLVVTIQNDNVSIESVFMFIIGLWYTSASGCGLCDMVLNRIALDYSTNCISQQFFSSLALQAMNFLHFYTMISFGGFLAECLPCYITGRTSDLQCIFGNHLKPGLSRPVGQVCRSNTVLYKCLLSKTEKNSNIWTNSD